MKISSKDLLKTTSALSPTMEEWLFKANGIEAKNEIKTIAWKNSCPCLILYGSLPKKGDPPNRLVRRLKSALTRKNAILKKRNREKLIIEYCLFTRLGEISG
jgi:hypothetical protein